MVTVIKEIELPPAASRTIEGLRDTGYEPETAIADIVDNSIAAEATIVAVNVWMEPDGELVVKVADDGVGMNADDLPNAMQYGSSPRPSPASLGKFGLGLKTASTAMCRQLTVVSTPGTGSDPVSARWDLDRVKETEKWTVQFLEVGDLEQAWLDDVTDESGTVVIWRKIDRLLPREYQDPTGNAAQRALNKFVERLGEHLRITYARYIEGSHGRKRVDVWLNDDKLDAWNPFGEEMGSDLVLDETIPVKINGVDTKFNLRAFVLPPASELDDEQEKQAKIDTAHQGFYVFREDRLISFGDWLGIARIEMHLNLSRIEFSFTHELDDAFQIDIKKSRILMMADLQDAVRRLIQPARAEADDRYRKNQKSRAYTIGGKLHEPSNRLIGKNAESLSRSTISVSGDGEAEVKNRQGRTVIEIPTLSSAEAGAPHVVPQDDLVDGLLWRPGIVDQKKAVLINSGHPYYLRVYLPNKSNGVAIQGMDFLLWSLCEAELAALGEQEKRHMQAVRREVSALLRELSLELPDIETP